MEKATKILSKIAAIAMIVLAALALVYSLITIFKGADFGEMIVLLLIFAAMLVVGILLAGAAKKIASVKFLVLSILALVMFIVFKVAYYGILPTYSAAIFGYISEGIFTVFFYVFNYGTIALIIVAAAALVLKIVAMCKK